MEISGAQSALLRGVRRVPNAVAARVLQGDVSDLSPGERVAARVVQTTSSSTVVDVNGKQLVLQSLLGTNVGDELFLRVITSRPNLVVQVGRPGTQQVPVPSNFAVGQQLTGEVVDQIGANRFLIDVQGLLLEASGPETLGKLGIVALEVEQVQPQLVFRILGETQLLERLAVETLAGNLESRRPIGETLADLFLTLTNFLKGTADAQQPEILARLQAALEKLMPGGGGTPDSFLANLVKNGTGFEAALARLTAGDTAALQQLGETNLKALLLQGLLALEGAEPLANAIIAHLSQMESQQLLNFLAQLQNDPYQFQVPFFDGESSTAYLSIHPDAEGNRDGGEGEQGEEAYSVLLNLELESFGKLKIDSTIGRDSVRVIFYVEREEALAALASSLPELERSLASLGFENVLLAGKPSGALTLENRQKFDMLTRGLPQSIHLVDVTG